MFKARLSRKKLLTLEWTFLAVLVYFSFCFFSATPIADDCVIIASNSFGDTGERWCAQMDKKYEDYLFWNILKDETTDPRPGGQGSIYDDLFSS